METPVTEVQHLDQEQPDESHENAEYTEDNDDSIKFQKFIYELFEKNGVLNDLRAHLRGHIISVLRTTGEHIPKCQKNFVQRLEYPYQAINMLIAEYFLRMNFNYSLSVFVSEMPLSNMGFDFAKSLLKLNPKDDVSNLTFNEPDIWSVLSFLGIQMDSEYAVKIRNMYSQREISLLDCLLKCVTLASLQAAHKEATIKQTQTQILPETIPDDVSLSSDGSTKTEGSKQSGRAKKCAYVPDKCNHYLLCKSCRRHFTRLKEKYKVQKLEVEKIFSQMKTVYDAEVEMVKSEEQKKVKRSVGSLVVRLRQKKAEMEEIYDARVEELERSVEEKKRFLWGLARGLRAQHENMARAMHHLKHETRRLTHKETLLKGQLLKAEGVIRARGEQIRTQITHELLVLAEHLDSIKREKELLKIERSELEKAESNYRLLKLSNADNNYEDLHARYDSLKTEMAILKKYIDTMRMENKVTSETSTNTEAVVKEGASLNNEQGVERGEERRAPNQLVNDLKKLKNVNFAQPQARESLRSVTQSASEDSQTQTQAQSELEKEYQRLRDFALAQREQMGQLTTQYEKLQIELAAAKRAINSMSSARLRPQTAPPRLEPFYITLQKASTNAASCDFGGGEQLTSLTGRTQRIFVPGDTLPFVGLVGQHQQEGKKHLLSQWRALRHLSPTRRVSKTRDVSPAPREMERRARPNSANPKLSPNAVHLAAGLDKPVEKRQREKSPKSMLREAKAKLRKDTAKRQQAAPHPSRDKSPTAVLREAKLRLRRLQIEAEAVEQSYKDFRNKQASSHSGSKLESGYSSPHSRSPNVQTILEASQSTRRSCDQILKNYNDSYDAYFKNRNSSSVRASPLPKEMAQLDRVNDMMDKMNDNYLDKPLEEFRKLYQIHNVETPSKTIEENCIMHDIGSPIHKEVTNDATKLAAETIAMLQHKDSNEVKEKFRQEQVERDAEYAILKENINKIYNLDERAVKEPNPVVTLHQAESLEWAKSDLESKHNECDSTELKVSLVCEDDGSETKPGRTKVLQSGYMLDCPTDTEAEVEELIVKGEKILSFDPNVPMKNSLLADVESFGKHDKLRQTPNSELLMFLESSVDNNAEGSSQMDGSASSKANKEVTSIFETAKTVDLKTNTEETRPRSRSPEQEANITRNDALEAIYNSHHDEENGETDQDGSGDYGDDFSADVDNYNVNDNMERSYQNSPHSMQKSEDNFWDS